MPEKEIPVVGMLRMFRAGTDNIDFISHIVHN